MRCTCGEDHDKEIVVKEVFLDSLLIRLDAELSIKGRPLDFKPNPKLGDGIATHSEMDYRKALLDLLETLYTYMAKVVESNGSPEEKKGIVKLMVDAFVKDGYVLVDKHLSIAFEVGEQEAKDKLSDLGITIGNTSKDLTRRAVLIEEQKETIEGMGWKILDGARKQINVDRVLGFYGTRTEGYRI